MAILEVRDGSPLGAIRELLGSMLSRGVVSAILAPQEIPSKKTVVQTLVRDPEKLDAVNPLAPVFGVNSARIIARMCVREMASHPVEAAVAEVKAQAATAAEGSATPQEEQQPAGETPNSPETPPPADEQPAAEAEAPGEQPSTPPIGVVLRPCEVRALVELVKLQQATLDPFLVIGVDCWGTFSVQDYAAKAGDGAVTADFLKQAAAGNFPEDLRGACRVCQHPAAEAADMSIQLIGEDFERQIRVQAHTQKGKDALAALGLEETPDADGREAAVAKLKEAKKQLAEQDEIDFVELISSLCINCHNCRSVCPICYCKQCVFDGPVFEYPIDKYLNWSAKKGILGMPTDKLLFHLTRMSHVATSCVACGQCEAACPSGIPLGRIYQRISAATQEALEYEAGRSLDDELPLTTFREEELSAFES